MADSFPYVPKYHLANAAKALTLAVLIRYMLSMSWAEYNTWPASSNASRTYIGLYSLLLVSHRLEYC